LDQSKYVGDEEKGDLECMPLYDDMP